MEQLERRDNPSLTLSASASPSTAHVGESVGILGSVFASEPMSALTATFVWGDNGTSSEPHDYSSGPTNLSPISQSHTYLSTGTYSVIVTANATYAAGGNDSATSTYSITILPPPAMAVVTVSPNGNVTENGSSGGFQFSRSTTAGSYSVSFTLFGGTASSSDYTYAPMVEFMDGQSTVNLNISAIDDTEFEGTETIVCTLWNGVNYTAGSPNVATINLNDDDVPHVYASRQSYDPVEGNEGLFRFTRTGNYSKALDILFEVGGKAERDIDYVSLGTTISFPEGVSIVERALLTFKDNIVETDGENVTVVVLDGGSVYSADSKNVADILIIDDAPIVSVVKMADATEGGANGLFRFTRTGGKLADSLPFGYGVSGTAKSKLDFAELSGAGLFPATVDFFQVTVAAVDDVEVEDTETVIVSVLAGAGNKVGTPANATVNIVDAPTIVPADIDIDGFDETTEDNPGGLVVERAADNNAPRKKIIIQQIPGWTGNVLFTKVSGGVKVFDAAAGGTEVTFNGTDNKYANANLPKTLYVQGNGASGSMRDTVLKAEPIIVNAKEKGAADTVSFTVLWVDVSVSFTGSVSGDNDKADTYKNLTTAKHYALGLQTYDHGTVKSWGWGFQAQGIVYPSEFNYPGSNLKLDRDRQQYWYKGSDPLGEAVDFSALASIPPGNDPSHATWRDDNPLDSDPYGQIFDTDAPNIYLVTSPKDEIQRMRFNFKEFADITIDETVVRASNIFEGFVRFSIKQTTAPTGSTWVTTNDVAGDNDAGTGKTKVTWNLA